MDYSDFDYKKACKTLSMKELEILLFKSRCSMIFTSITERYKKDCPRDLISYIVVGFVGLFYISLSVIYAFFNGICYLLTHKEEDKSVIRYSEIRWDKKKVCDDDGYTTLADMERMEAILDEIREKIIEEERNKRK